MREFEAVEAWLRIPRKIPENCWERESHNNKKTVKTDVSPE